MSEHAMPALEMRDVRKTFPGTVAVDQVSLQVYPGEVHALIGENGAGKSTLMKMLAGAFSDYEGEILIDGETAQLHTPAAAKQLGVGMIYQELSLAQPLSIAENVLVGRLPTKGPFVDRNAMVEQAAQNLRRVGLELNPLTPVEDISQHEQQLVEIAKVLGTDPHILVMDEPTSALSREEVERLFEIIHRLKREGLAIVYISHHLPEVFHVADRVTVLRDGHHIATEQLEDVTPEQLIEMMVGREVEQMYGCRDVRSTFGEKFRVEHLSRYGFFHDVSFSVEAGEILGICGLSGAGRTELARSIIGIDPIHEGSMYLNGQEIQPRNMQWALRHGISYLTEDRKKHGLALRLSLGENVLSSIIPRLARNGFYRASRGSDKLKGVIDDLSIYPNNPAVTIANLSGGNQQKALLGKWLATDPQVFILDEPTRGVDVGAKVTIHEAIEQLAEDGNAVILISSDLPELVGMSDRVLIMRQGHITREMHKADCTEEGVLLAANGEGAVDGATDVERNS